jgi:replicative DNA helicase
LSRKCEERVDKRPILSDLRESGSLEQDSDIVIGLYRPSYYYEFSKDRDYKKEYDNNEMAEEDYKRISELLILKHRNGETDRRIKENFFGEFSRFTPRELETVSSYSNQFIEPVKLSTLNDNDIVPF